ncbi:MAG: ROK family protein [Akkermansia sp.]|nr:ROK family protein [Akkermansia sp.]
MAEDMLSIGVDMGGTSIKFAVVRGTEIIDRAEPVRTQDFVAPDAIFAEVGKRLRELIARYPQVKAVGMGIPGFVDHDKGIADSLTNVPGWYDVPVRAMLEEMTGLPAAVDNDANCMAYAEWKLGAGKGLNDLVCLTLGTGVGSGIVANGRMLRGSLGAAGELGHVSIDYQGRPGYYHNFGALENYIGHPRIQEDAAAAYAAAGQEKSFEDCAPYPLELAAKEGDAIALEMWDSIARKLATGLLNCHYLLNPAAFIIGGGVAKAGELLMAPLRGYLKAQMYAPHYARLQILPAMFSNDAGIIGAARMALEEAENRQA